MKGAKGPASLLLVAIFFLLLSTNDVNASEWIPLAGAVHVHTSEFSSGDHTLNELAGMALEKGVEVIVLNDHDKIAMSYGIPPFQNILSMTVSRNSVLKQGARKYLEAVNEADAANPDVLLIPGLESAPFYYWSGSLRSGGITANDWRKHIHIIGLSNPDDIEGLPILRNGLSGRYFFPLLPGLLIFSGVILLSLVLISWSGFYRTTGKVFLVLGILGALDAHPFKSSLYDPYHGEQGAAPYQELIDYVEAHGGMTFWAHPEAHYGANETLFQKKVAGFSLPRVYMNTGVHPGDLIQTDGYTGFESLYGDTIHATDAGREWDRVLIQYCNGERKKPAWGLCGIDFHKQGQNSWSELDRGQTVFWVREKTRSAVLEAMRNGRMYAVFQGGEPKMHLDLFSVSTRTGDEKAVSGETIESKGELLNIQIVVSLDDAASVQVQVEIIDSGKILATIEGETPLKIKKNFMPSRRKGYVRAMIKSKQYRIVTNPIFYNGPKFIKH